MKKKISFLVLALVMLLSIVPMSGITVNAATAVTGVEQTGAGETSIDIKWNAVLGESTYNVQVSEDSKNWVVTETAYRTTARIANLSAGKTYYVRVSGTENNAYSTPIKVTTGCEKVKNLKQTTATTSSITVTWDKVYGATKYQVCEWVNGQEYVVGTTTGNTYTIKGFDNKKSFPYNIYVKPLREIDNGYVAGKDALDYCFRANYLGSYDINLIPAKLATPTINNYWSNLQEVNMKLQKTNFAKGYEYQLYTAGGKKVSSGDMGTSDYKFLEQIKSTSFYKVRVRAYTYIGGVKKPLYGEWSNWKYFANSPNKLSLKKKGKGVKVSWKKTSGATNYTIYASTNRNGKFKKVATTKKTSYIIKKVNKKKIKKGKTYYVYVVANKKVGKTTCKSGSKDVYYFYFRK